ncbi:MAG: hypothetical protein II024_02740, partial [Firmicutes bacterium]|nr:hypothetical protein [Bacillota bacterium]
GGNGTDDAINTYDFPDDMVSLYANWTVVNKYDEPNEDANTYELTVTNTTKDLKTVSPDNWGVEKLPFGEPQLDKTNNTVTFKWKVNVGMIDPNSTPENKVLLTADPVYYGHGRDAVTSFTLGELITANYINNGALTPLHPDGGTISISKSSTGANSYELSLTADAGSIVVWPADSATSSDLVMNSVQVDADGNGLKDNDPYVPAYTTYYVTAVYKYTPDMIGQFTEPARQISAKNKVSSTAVLPNKDNQTDNAENTQNRALFVDDPASFIITKDLKLKNGTTVNYAGENKKYGDLGFTITDAAGNPVTIYSRSGNADDGYTYEPYTGDLEQTTNLTQPKVYYVLPGVTYKITETIDSRYTDYMEPAAAGGETVTKGPLSSGGQPVDFRFTNKETIGSITVKKEDTAGHPVKGAKFKLVSVGENGTETQVGEILETEGTNTATCTWNDLPYGTYKLYEVESAPGYVKMDAENGLPLTITIPYTDENDVVHVDYTTPVLKNQKTQATATLHKYVGANGALSTFNRLEETVDGATYLLERSSDGGRTWESAKTYDGTVITAKPLSSFGFLEYNVPASENDVTYTYRWKETLSNNDTYIPVNHPENDTKTGYSDTFTMTEGDSKTSIIYNRTLTKIKVQKEGKQYDTKGAFGYITDIEVPVTLYRYSGTGTPTSVSQLEDLGTQTAKYNDNNATWDKLPWYTGANGSETAYTYYVKETIDSTFVFDSATLGGTTIDPSNYVEIGGEKYIKVDVSSGSEDYAVKLINYKKAIPVQIVKRDQNGNPTIPGCEFTIYDSNGNVALDARTLDPDDKLENLGYSNNVAGVYVYLEPGKTYTYKETKEANSHFLEADSDNPLVQVDKGGVIITPTFTPGQTMTVKTYVVKNQVHPTIRIYKRNSASTSTNVTGAKYSVYTRSGEAPNYTYTPVLASNGQPLVLNANGSASTERLSPGTYYFTESTVPANFLNPNYEHSAEVYEALDTTNTYIYESSVGTHGTT